MQKLSRFRAQMKRHPKCQLGRFCPESFNYDYPSDNNYYYQNLSSYLVDSDILPLNKLLGTGQKNNFFDLQQLCLRALNSRFENNYEYKIFS